MNAHSSQNYSTQVEGALECLINMHLQASEIYISLSFYFVSDLVAQKDVGHFFCELAEKKYMGAHRLLTLRQRGSEVLCQAEQQVPHNGWCSNVDAMEAALSLEKSINQALTELYTLGWSKGDCRLCDFLVSYFLEEEIKVIHMICYHLTNVQRLAGMEADLSESLSKLSLNPN
uniref:Ferritin n=1 Tax=Cavia porcellus TaxID=10141 RepID=H0W943_CAVPO